MVDKCRKKYHFCSNLLSCVTRYHEVKEVKGSHRPNVPLYFHLFLGAQWVYIGAAERHLCPPRACMGLGANEKIGTCHDVIVRFNPTKVSFHSFWRPLSGSGPWTICSTSPRSQLASRFPCWAKYQSVIKAMPDSYHMANTMQI